MINEVLQLREEPQSKKAHVDVKFALTKDLLNKLRNHGRRLRKMKKHLTLLREEILSRCHVGDEKGGQNIEEEGGDEVEVEVGDHKVKFVTRLQLLLKE